MGTTERADEPREPVHQPQEESAEAQGRVVLVWDRGGPGDVPRTWEWSGEGYRRLRVSLLFLGAAALLVGGLLFVRGVQGWGLAQRVAELEAEQAQVDELIRTLDEVEAAYERLRGLFLPERAGEGGLWLPPAGSGALRPPPPSPADGVAGEDAPPPSTWPLVERGVLTQPLVAPDEGGVQGHPGIDLAVPSGSYFRAVGSGIVAERGEDEVYGLYVVVDHPGGYRSLYAHASVVVVEEGRAVRDGEVLGLTGSSGRSTAPHLHLELSRNGEPLDPLTLLRRP
jgi:murein DD-endopeptidase MepM/ murein hydrolase activator NlpD